MYFGKLKYLLLALWAVLVQSITVPAQTSLPQLGMDSRIERGTLGCGATYYMVNDPVRKGYAQIALVQQRDSLSAAKKEALSLPFLSRMGVSPGPRGYVSGQDGATIYRFSDVRFYRPEVLDSVLLYTFMQMASSVSPQAVIVSGDIDPVELKKKMDIFSMLVRRLPARAQKDNYQWQNKLPSLEIYSEGPAGVEVAYAGARVPLSYMNTAQALVTDLFSLEFQLILWHRLQRNLKEAGIPYGSIEFLSRRSVDSAGDETYGVRIGVAPAQLEAALGVLSSTLSEIDSFGAGADEFAQAKQVLLPSMQRRAFATPAPEDYIERCCAHYLYGAQLAPYTEPLRFFARKRVSDTTEARLFSNYAGALLGQLENLSLRYGPVETNDTTDTEGDVLLRYNLHYLLGSLQPTRKDYTWHPGDTLGMEVNCPKVKIKSEKAEAVTGGTLWTFSNGIRVIYKHVKGSGRISYALQLNGGLSQISQLREGEGGYMGELLSLCDAGGLPAAVFQDMLLSNGIRMGTRVDLNSMAISGDAPADKLSLLMKALLSLSQVRSVNASEYNYFRQCQLLGELPASGEMQLRITPGYKYTSACIPGSLGEDTPKKAAKYFEDRFSRINDGVIILCGDISPEAVRRHMLRYLGGFHVVRGTVARKAVEMHTLSGTTTFGEEGTPSTIHVMLDAAYPMTSEHVYVSQVALEALKLSLARHLGPHGYSAEASVTTSVHPQERFRIQITCTPGADARPWALSAVRAAIHEAASAPVEAADLKAWKALVEARQRAILTQPDSFVTTLLARYAANKDVLTGYQQTLSGITASQVQEFLSTMASGGCVEYIESHE